MKTKLFQLLAIAFLGANTMNVSAQDYSTPQPGEIWGGYIDALNETRTQLDQVLAQVLEGDDGQASPWFLKLKTIKTQLDHVTNSKSQVDFFALVPNLAEVFVEHERLPFVAESFGPLTNLSIPLISTAGTHAKELKGTVTDPVLCNFVTIFAVGDGFVSEANWEYQSMPIDAPGVMILDCAAVLSKLKAGPWQQASQFVGGATTASGFFARYTGSGDGLSVLKTKYAASQATIDAKYNELKAWVEEQKKKAEDGK